MELPDTTRQAARRAFRCISRLPQYGPLNPLRRGCGPIALLIVCALATSGCEVKSSTFNRAIISERALIDFTGLCVVQNYDSLKVSGALPRGWDPLPLDQTPLYTHQQWRSPTIATGVGVAYVHLPIPVPAKAIVWFARTQYARQSNDGKSLGQWTDSIGREWFEAENNRYHVRGYAVTRGMDAWIIYCGFRRTKPAEPYDISLAVRSMETIAPMVCAPASQPGVSATAVARQ